MRAGQAQWAGRRRAAFEGGTEGLSPGCPNQVNVLQCSERAASLGRGSCSGGVPECGFFGGASGSDWLDRLLSADQVGSVILGGFRN